LQDGQTPLPIAARKRNVRIMEELLGVGADPNFIPVVKQHVPKYDKGKEIT